MIHREIQIESTDNSIFTSGLESHFGYEIKLLQDTHSIENYQDVITYFIDYILDAKPTIKADQTSTYRCWLVQFKQADPRFFDLWEVKSDGSGFSYGLEHAITVINAQKEVCNQINVTPIFPIFNQQVLISKDVLKGNRPVQAVRLSSSHEMTGWQITTDHNNPPELSSIYFYDLAFKRPDLLKYLALPFGFNFTTVNGSEKIWFDKQVLLERN